METQYLKIVKHLTPEFSYSNFDTFIDNLHNQEMEWYTTFRRYVSDQIEESDFEELAEDGVRLLLPVRTMAAMHIMQQGFGWTDQELIDECRNNLRVRHALSIGSEEEIPPISALNKFRSLLNEFKRNTGIDLMEELVEKIAEHKGPVKKLGGSRIMLWAMRVA